MFKLRGSISDYDKAQFEQCITVLWNDFEVSVAKDSDVSKLSEILLGFELLKGWDSVTIVQACLVEKNSNPAMYVVLVMDRTVEGISSKGQNYVHQINEAYQLFLAEMEKDLGHIVIRPETLTDKIDELFGNIDIDFKEHPNFSKKYFALSETPDDESKFRKNVGGTFLDTVARHKDLRIEIKDKKMIATTGRRINEKDAVKLAKFVFEVGE